MSNQTHICKSLLPHLSKKPKQNKCACPYTRYPILVFHLRYKQHFARTYIHTHTELFLNEYCCVCFKFRLSFARIIKAFSRVLTQHPFCAITIIILNWYLKYKKKRVVISERKVYC